MDIFNNVGRYTDIDISEYMKKVQYSGTTKFRFKEHMTRIFFSGFLEFNMYKKRLQAFKVLEISKNLFFRL